MPLDQTEAVKIGARAVKLLVKVARFAKGGFSPEEKRELGLAFLDLGADVLADAGD